MLNKSKIISHSLGDQYTLIDHQKRIRAKDSLNLSVNESLQILEQLTEFDLGRFLLQNKGLNGFWTSYIILNGIKKSNLSPLEEWMIHKSPIVLATRERFYIFRRELQKILKNNMVIASTPCGLMDDLLSLDFSQLSNIQLKGLDLDPESIKLATENIKNYNVSAEIEFLIRDAWNLGIKEEYDVIVSNGLNIYEPNIDKLKLLYSEFANALKPGGILITSFLTPGPTMSENSPWKDFILDDVIQQKVIFMEILEVAWQTYRTERETIAMFEDTGFDIQNIIYDRQAMFPTIILKKN